jgi:hypothetical protein
MSVRDLDDMRRCYVLDSNASGVDIEAGTRSMLGIHNLPKVESIRFNVVHRSLLVRIV